ncbi:MAG: hypothetical protein FWF54_07965 [Candidatus Azobacteroides sp.]|nr:hypothetical protein [Candidatus Azobacteroides sp.]
MKKTALLFIFSCAFILSANAQLYKNSIGVALGSPTGFQYKTFISDQNAVDLTLGTNYRGFNLTGAYEWNFPIPDAANFQWYIGPAAAVGYWDHKDDNGFFLAVYGGGGVEYKFDDIPLVLSLDLFPVGISFVEHSGYTFQSRLGIRYTF